MSWPPLGRSKQEVLPLARDDRWARVRKEEQRGEVLGWSCRAVAFLEMCDLNGYWVDADTDAALDLVREVGRGAVGVRDLAERPRGWAVPT